MNTAESVDLRVRPAPGVDLPRAATETIVREQLSGSIRYGTSCLPASRGFTELPTLGPSGSSASPSAPEARAAGARPSPANAPRAQTKGGDVITLFLCGDVMTGRGIDQVLPHPSSPKLYESYLKSALGYVDLAQQAYGPFPVPVDFAYVWGDALPELERMAPDARIVNLETAVTRSDAYWRGKGIHYRMHPGNGPCLTAAKIDCCVLANNHVLDWGRGGLEETLVALGSLGIKTAGAGANRAQAEAPAILDLPARGRVVVYGFGAASSGIARDWMATEARSGVNLLPDLSAGTARRIAAQVRAVKRERDVVVASIHWGANWGYEIPQEHARFAHALIDEAGVDIVHGHSSHHVKGIDVYRGKLILYGCGDFLTDYEGITGYEAFRGDLGLMYFPAVDPETGTLSRMTMTPTRVRRFRVNRATPEEARWLMHVLARERADFRTHVSMDDEGRLALDWDRSFLG